MFVFRAHLLTGEQEMHATARLALRAINEHIHIKELVVNEPGGFQSGSSRG